MTFSSLISEKILADSSNYSKTRSGKKVCKITPHHAAGVISGKACAKLFQNPKRNCSATYCIGNNGEIVGSTPEECRPWTSSSSANDKQAITIEVSNCEKGGQWKISDKAFNSLVELCVDICKRYNFKLTYDGTPNGSLTRHNMFSKTACPGPYLQSKFPELVELVNSRLGEKPQPKPQPTPTPNFLPSKGYFKYGDVSNNIGKVADFMYKNFPAYTPKSILSSKNHFGPSMLSTIKNFQKRTRLVVDGYLGRKTYEKLKSFGFKG